MVYDAIILSFNFKCNIQVKTEKNLFTEKLLFKSILYSFTNYDNIEKNVPL